MNRSRQATRRQSRPAGAGRLLPLGLLLLAVSAAALPSARRDTPRLLAVMAAGTPAAPALRVSVAVPYAWLVFRREPGEATYRARARLAVEVLRGDRLLGGDVVTAEARVARERAAWSSRPLELAARVALADTGEVRLRLTVTGVGTRRLWRHEVDVRPGRLLRAPVTVLAASWRTVPPGRLLAAPGDSVVLDLRLVATRRGRPLAGVELAALPAGGGDTLVVDRRRLAAAPGETLAVRLAATADRLPFGEHELLPRLQGRPLPGVARLDLFDLVIPWSDDRAWARHVAWLDGIVDRATRDSLRHLPAERRAAAWRRLWEARPPGARPTEREHLLRIVEADRRFGGFGRGALSDRGRVFIRLGEPDRIEEFADERTYPGRWEVWYYERLGVAYRFYDSFGLGDYRLYDTVPI